MHEFLKDDAEAPAVHKGYLAGCETPSGLPKISARPQEKGYRKEELLFSIDQNLTDKLKTIAKEEGATLAVLMQTVWGLRVSRSLLNILSNTQKPRLCPDQSAM